MEMHTQEARDVLNKHLGAYVFVEGILVILWRLHKMSFEVLLITSIIFAVVQLFSAINELIVKLAWLIWAINNGNNEILLEFLIRKERGEINLSPNSKMRSKEIMDLTQRISDEIATTLSSEYKKSNIL